MTSDEVTAVLEILDRYFDILQSGRAGDIFPDPEYQWRFYKGDVTIERLRKALVGLDSYLGADSQKNWVIQHLESGETFTAGPDLNRLPDAAVLALFQECDTYFAGQIKPEQSPQEPDDKPEAMSGPE